ncbi:MAG TPA: cardiolipin synthase [Bacillota bacterium]|nr:cardiolipin synthase [Bacillota bacterium]
MKRGFLVILLFVIVSFVYTILLVQSNTFELIGNLFEQSGIEILSGPITIYSIEIGLSFLAVVIVFRLVLKQTYATNKAPWILVMLLAPIVGITLYVIFARDFTTRRLALRRPLIAQKAFLKLEEPTEPDLDRFAFGEIFGFIKETTGRSVYQDDTRVELLNNGDVFFPRLMEECRRAKEYIMMEFYILKSDGIGRQVMDILKEKALAGVDVYLIYDHFGSVHHLKKDYLKSLRASGVKIAVFDPQRISLFNSNVNFRNHRKATVIDGNVGFVGGMNLGDEYNHGSPKFGFWRDSHLLIKGNGVTSIQNVFVKDWYYITGALLEKPLDKSVESFPGLFSVVESGPDFENGLIKDVYLKMISSAKKSIKIVTPYLIIDPELMSALKIAVKSGVDVTFLVPGMSDRMMVGFATKSYYEPLLNYGIKIFELTGHFVHSKIMVIDDTVASVGSVNFDPRSFHINFEVTAVFANRAVDDVVTAFSADLSRSTAVSETIWQKRGFFRRVIQGLVNLFSPLF